jgi:hypothetical protein
MRAKLGERQQAMRKKLLAARETFKYCAFRQDCLKENPEMDSESCSQCSPSILQGKIPRSISSPD